MGRLTDTPSAKGPSEHSSPLLQDAFGQQGGASPRVVATRASPSFSYRLPTFPRTVSVCQLAGGASEEESIAHRRIQRKLIGALVLAFVFMIVEVVGGIYAHSLAIITDAAHLLSDVSGFIVAVLAAYWAKRRSMEHFSYGYHRVEVLGALASVMTVWLVTGILLFEAVNRIITPEPVDGKIMFIIAMAGVGCNLLMMLILGGHHHHGGAPCSHGHGHSHDHGHSHSHGDKAAKRQLGPALEVAAVGSGGGACCGGHGHSHNQEEQQDHNHGYAAAAAAEEDEQAAHDLETGGGAAPQPARRHGHSHGGACCGGHGGAHANGVAEQHEHGSHHHHHHSHSSDPEEGEHSHHHHSHHSSDEEEEELEVGASGRTPILGAAGHKHGSSCGGATGGGHAHAHSHGGGGGCGGHSHGHGHGHGHDHANLNVRGAIIHVIGDFVQSIGVAIAGALIWWHQDNPAWYIADPICTFLFAALVLWTTRAILRDISDVLMERVPRGLCIKTINDDLSRVAGVEEVHDLHVWSLTPGIPLLCAHINLSAEADPTGVLHELNEYCRSIGISHSTLQLVVNGSACPCEGPCV